MMKAALHTAQRNHSRSGKAEYPERAILELHADVDMHHLSMGLDLCEPSAPDSPTGTLYHRVLWHSA